MPPHSFAAVGRRITAWTSNLLASAVVLLLALGVGRQLVAWYRVESPPVKPAAVARPPLAGLADGELIELDFGELPFQIQRREFFGDLAAARAALLTACRDLAGPMPLAPPSPAESNLLELCRQQTPTETTADGRRIFAPETVFPLVVVLRAFVERDDSLESLSENRPRKGGQAHFAHQASQNEPVPGGSRIGSKLAAGENRVVVWGMASPAGPDQWHLYVAHGERGPGAATGANPAASGAAAVENRASNELPLPPGARRMLGLRDQHGGKLSSFAGAGEPSEWIAFFAAWFGERQWSRSADWSFAAGVWRARYEQDCGAERTTVDLQIGPGAAAGLVGFATIERQTLGDPAPANEKP